MIIIVAAVFVYLSVKALGALFGFAVAAYLTPLLARAIVGWHLDPYGPDGDFALLGWGLGAVLTPPALMVILLSVLDSRTQIALAISAVTFLAFCSWKTVCRLRFHGVI
ncbi:MAG: hypothetical protein K8T20_12575 [Planctomycetes bacterium]|nr:hypothetical protein [Planctomycetota bacterium]